MLETEKRELLRGLPAVDAVLRASVAEVLVSRYGRAGVTAAVREALGRAREEILNGGEPPVSEEDVLAMAARILSGRGLRRVVNATGVVLHTNLGRSVLSERAVEAVVTAGASHSELGGGPVARKRGARHHPPGAPPQKATGGPGAVGGENSAGPAPLPPSAGG